MKNYLILFTFLIGCNTVPAIDSTPVTPQECGTTLTECSCDPLSEDDYPGRVFYEDERCESNSSVITTCNIECPRSLSTSRICFCEP